MDTDAYLARIGFSGFTEPTHEVLCALHRAHLCSVPFENLSIHDGERIQLDESWLFDKIVHRRRGGFCYELNGLFAALLRELGFDVSLREARVYGDDGEPGIPFDHLVLVVTLDEPYLADVGFGDSFVTPVPIRIGESFDDGRARFAIQRDGGECRLMRRDVDGDSWVPQFRIEDATCELADFAPGCDYHQSSPGSPFTKGRVCSLVTGRGGRVTLRERTLIETAPGGARTEIELDSEAEVTAVLVERFGVSLR